MSKPKILIIDDELIFIKKIEFKASKDFEVGFVVPIKNEINRFSVLEKIKKIKWDLILLDLGFYEYEIDGLSLINEIKDINPNIAIIVATKHNKNIPYVVKSIKSGASNYLPKQSYSYPEWKKIFVEAINEIWAKKDLPAIINKEEKELFRDCLPFIEKNQFKKYFKCISNKINKNNDKFDSLIILKARYNNLNTRYTRGMISDEKFDIELNILRKSMIDLLS